MQNVFSLLSGARAKVFGLAFAAMALASMLVVNVASATTTVDISPAITKTETEFGTELPLILTLIGLLTAASLVILFFRKHAKKA